MARCAATKPDGSPCERIVGASQEYCYAHDPGRREERRRNAARAGKSTGNREIRDLRKQLAELYTATLEGRVDRSVAAVLAQIANARTRLLATELKIKEAEEFEERLRRLEEAV